MDTMEQVGANLRLKVLEAENAKMRAVLADSDAIVVAQLAATLMGGGYYASVRTATEGVGECIGLARNLLAESRRQAAAPEDGRDER